MRQIPFSGIFSVVPTPFNYDESLDLEGVERLVDFYLGKGVHGLTILGVLGEADKLLPDERVLVIEAFLHAVDNRVPVIIGSSHAGTRPAVALATQAEGLGAAGILVAPPSAKSNPRLTLKDHLHAIEESTSIPIVLQDYPAHSGVQLSPELLVEMADHVERLQAVKIEDPPTPAKIYKLRQLAGDRLKLLGGYGGMFFFEELEQGASGTMTGFAFPEALLSVFTEYNQGNKEGAAMLFYRVLPLLRFEFQHAIGLALRKEILRRRGALRSASLRAPAELLDEASAGELTRLLARLGLDKEEYFHGSGNRGPSGPGGRLGARSWPSGG